VIVLRENELASVTVSSAAALFPGSALVDGRRDHGWRSTGVTSETIESPSGLDLNRTCIVYAHGTVADGLEVGAGADVFVETSSGAGWVAVADPRFYVPPAHRPGTGCIMALFTHPTHDRFRIRIENPGDPLGYFGIGEIWFGAYETRPSRALPLTFDFAWIRGIAATSKRGAGGSYSNVRYPIRRRVGIASLSALVYPSWGAELSDDSDLWSDLEGRKALYVLFENDHYPLLRDPLEEMAFVGVLDVAPNYPSPKLSHATYGLILEETED